MLSNAYASVIQGLIAKKGLRLMLMLRNAKAYNAKAMHY